MDGLFGQGGTTLLQDAAGWICNGLHAVFVPAYTEPLSNANPPQVWVNVTDIMVVDPENKTMMVRSGVKLYYDKNPFLSTTLDPVKGAESGRQYSS